MLVNQVIYNYPIFLFTESHTSWNFEGTFSVTDIENRHVVLMRGSGKPKTASFFQEDINYQEGDRRYASHLIIERNKAVVRTLKANSSLICDICSLNFIDQYGVNYIEAHHKISISTHSSTHTVRPEDFVLLCPNCHVAVHIYMRLEGLGYQQIKEKLCCKRD